MSASKRPVPARAPAKPVSWASPACSLGGPRGPHGPGPAGPAGPAGRSVLDGPRLRLHCRDYLLFTGSLSAAASMGWHAAPEWVVPQSPNLFWPHDRSWCVATEIDLDSTLVAGTDELVRAVLAAPGLEAWPVAADDF